MISDATSSEIILWPSKVRRKHRLPDNMHSPRN
jgi:hypothetical protein